MAPRLPGNFLRAARTCRGGADWPEKVNMDVATCTQDVPVLCDYELLSLIAEGSMASVYRGRRREDGLPVAIKIPHRAVAGNEVLRQRFQTEYRIGRELDHPNIVRTLGFGQESGNCFLVLEL